MHCNVTSSRILVNFLPLISVCDIILPPTKCNINMFVSHRAYLWLILSPCYISLYQQHTTEIPFPSFSNPIGAYHSNYLQIEL